MTEKRTYTRIAPLHWNVAKAKSLWDKGILVREIAKEVGVAEATILKAVKRYDWPRRKRHKIGPIYPIPQMYRCYACFGISRTKICECEGHGKPQAIRSLYLEAAA